MIKMKPWAAIVAITLAGTLTCAQAQVSNGKKDLIQRLQVITQPEIDVMAQQIATQPASQLIGMSQQILANQVPADKREAAAKQIEAALKKYADEAVPLVKAAANKASPGIYSALLDEKFTEAELRQLVTFLESPVRKKWQLAVPELQNELVRSVIDSAKDQVDPKLNAAQQTITKVLETASGKSFASNPAPAAPAASGAAPKKK